MLLLVRIRFQCNFLLRQRFQHPTEWNYGRPSLRLSESVIIIVGLTQFNGKGELLQLNRYTPTKTKLNHDY